MEVIFMNTKTDKEKAKRYDQALEKARQLCAYPTTKPFISDLQDLFPELKESDDDEIREWLINLVKSHIEWLEDRIKEQLSNGQVYGGELNEAKDAIAWLEKGEQKPAWSEEDEDVLEDVEEAIINYWHGQSQEDLLDWLKSLKGRVLPQPKQEWSEEDEKCLENAIMYCEWARDKAPDLHCYETSEKSINWLKSLKPQKQ